MTDVQIAEDENGALGGSLTAGMPRRPDYIGHPDQRPRLRRDAAPRFPFPMPNGWFIVAKAEELAPLEVAPLYYFGCDLVLYRTAAGANAELRFVFACPDQAN